VRRRLLRGGRVSRPEDTAPRDARVRAGDALAALGVALGLNALALGWWFGQVPPDPGGAEPVRVVDVRGAQAPVPTPSPAPSRAQAPLQSPRLDAPAGPAETAAKPAPPIPRAPGLPQDLALALPSISPATPATPAASISATASTAVAASAASGPAAGSVVADGGVGPAPVYPVRLPPSFALDYTLQRGERQGEARLEFTRDAAGYTLRLRGWIDQAEVLGLDSRGRLDATGLAPQRHVERQRGRERLAVNFDADRGVVSYSGPKLVHPLHPGLQDRLSWLPQLAAIVDADPARWRPGAQIVLAITGTRGDLDHWRFEVREPDTEAPAGTTGPPRLRLVREPARPYDLRVETWLDPAHHHLPARLRLTVVPGGAALELRTAPREPGTPPRTPAPAQQ
jgi:hypothetical protein